MRAIYFSVVLGLVLGDVFAQPLSDPLSVDELSENLDQREIPPNFNFPTQCPTVTPTDKELVVYNLLNEHRMLNGLPAIKYSPRLSCLARRHGQDQVQIGLTHGWINCPYSSADSSTWHCSNNSPSRLGVWTGQAYEISCGVISNGETCVALWKTSPGHNTTILEQGMTWSRFDWHEMGVGTHNGYWNVYFTDGQTPEARFLSNSLVDTSFLVHSYFVNESLGGQSILLVGDNRNRISGTLFTYDDFNDPTWRNFIAEQISSNTFEGDMLYVKGSSDSGAFSFQVDGRIVLSINSETEVEINYRVDSLGINFQGLFRKFEVDF